MNLSAEFSYYHNLLMLCGYASPYHDNHGG